jgi:hypothetical protein
MTAHTCVTTSPQATELSVTASTTARGSVAEDDRNKVNYKYDSWCIIEVLDLYKIKFRRRHLVFHSIGNLASLPRILKRKSVLLSE